MDGHTNFGSYLQRFGDSVYVSTVPQKKDAENH